MIIYIDITLLEKGRGNTGIQRVVKEFLQRVMQLDTTITFKILRYNQNRDNLELLDNEEVKLFLKNIKEYQFINPQQLDIYNIKANNTTIFFDIDSPWNSPIQRDKLYPILQENGFLIFNFIYDLVPVLFPELAHSLTVKNFSNFLDSVYKYSTLVLTDSQSAQNDFNNYKKSKNIRKDTPTRFIGLGSDFLQNKQEIKDQKIKQILEKKYILFVGTLEPRKNQADMLAAFEVLSSKYPDANLVFIGKQGWRVESLIHKINNHPLKDKKLFWLNEVDDDTLNHFYQNAFIVTYLSLYEGYGLPIAESLNFGNITITSKNSSMYEVGKDCADYINYNSKNELVDIISLYWEDQELYRLKKEYIKENYISTTWDIFSNSVMDIFTNYTKSLELKQNHSKKLQFVFISIEIESIKQTIEKCDKYIDFIKEYIIITAPKCINEFNELKSIYDITIIDETNILGKYAKDFHKRDHQSKNWLLRASLVNLTILDDEYIMLDDDNQPLKPISLDKFITKEGRYNAYYFYELLKWNHKGTEYDRGQHNTAKVLADKNYELLSYSSHAPQIINKKIFREVVEQFFDIGLISPIDEWSIYFNYAVSNYPDTFNKKIFETLNWPDNPYHWEHIFTQDEISFENYYSVVYQNKLFNKDNTYEEKLSIKNKEIEPFINTRKMFEQNKDILSSQNMVHGNFIFKNDDIKIIFSNIPYFVVVEKNSDIRLKLNYKLLNMQEKEVDIVVSIFINGRHRTSRKINGITVNKYQESIFELPINAKYLQDGIYNMTFNLKINDNDIDTKDSPYLTKLLVSSKNINGVKKLPIITNENQSLKEKLKTIPFLGSSLRWLKNLIKLNNTNKQIHLQNIQIQKQNKQIQEQNKQIQEVSAHIQTLLRHNHQHHQNYKDISQTIYSQISKQITNQALLFHNRIDEHFNQKVQDVTPKIQAKSTILTDDFYLSFEDTFRGSRELILERCKPYLEYLLPLNPESSTLHALDIGCGRGEWTQFLQENNIDAHGIDLNFAMVNIGLSQNVKNLQKADAFEFLASCEDNSFEIITAFHIIEHIPYEMLLILLQEIKRVATPNAVILLETPNPQNLTVASYEFYKDPTHLNPLPAPVIKFMVEYIGFKNVHIDYLHPLNNTQSTTPATAQDYLIIANK